MKKNLPLLLILCLIFCSYSSFGQVGINTTNPDASSALEIESTTSGLLIPRMTTTEIEAIVDPAPSLLVYDTDLDGYYFNKGTTETPDWKLLLTDINSRENYVIVKSVDDFPTASGGTITLDENTLYEVNGLISTSNSINVNGAYLIGKDTNEDIINYTGSGALFTGATNASFRNITFNNSGTGDLFNLSASVSNSLIAQSVIVNGFNSIGTVSTYGLVFFNVMQFVNNTDGITYNNIGNLLLNNMGWQSSNSGTFETFTGTFSFVQKVSGFTTVPSGATGFDVSSNPTVTNGTMKGVVFAGAGDYVDPYTGAGTYNGFNFTNDWEVDCIGIPRESDNNASGNIYIQRNSTTSNPTFSIASATPLDALIDAGQMFRFANAAPAVTSGDNVLEYEGKEARTFQVSGNVAYEPTTTNGSATVHAFYIQRFNSAGVSQGVPLGTEIYEEVGSSGNASTGDYLVRAIPLSGKVTLNPGDYVRIYGQTISNTGTPRNSIRVYSLSLTLD
ncbi:hypothetical protein [Mesonia sp.]|uniref:hypothetical protein n=1 Tax=Mesonia sp. TaxID=1960830 RepID=UPI0017705440|nr:hypothetical protein [Mesonia sp.]HIB36480.1 hypothetical protein [Mesonia sp.]HIO27965.1 hypothetical protein [Flavobacteriaceae bacterium]